MIPQPLTWPVVDQAAAELGALAPARRKWRQDGRGVPAIWRIKIAEHLAAAGTPILLADFDKLEVNPGRIAA